MNKPRLIQTYLPDGSLEGIKVIELSESSVKAFVVPRIKLSDVKKRPEINQPSLYLLINSAENQLYIGESENFYHRVKNHDQSKDFWDLAISIVSNTNSLEKSDVKYLESLAIEKAQSTAAMEVLNKTIPVRNNVHEFKIHTLKKILDDTSLIAESLGFSIFKSKESDRANIWYLDSKKTSAKAEFRGDKMILLAGSKIDPSYSERWSVHFPNQLLLREKILKDSTQIIDGAHVLIRNIPFNSPSQASGFATGRNSNGWKEWRNSGRKTMDEIMRKES